MDRTEQSGEHGLYTGRASRFPSQKNPSTSNPSAHTKVTPINSFSWPARFYQRNPIPTSWENRPWITMMIEGSVYDLGEIDASLLHVLNAEPNWAPDTYRVNSLLDIIGDATLGKLQNGDVSVPERKVALLIDGNNGGSEPQLRTFLGGLSARSLLKELQKQRYGENTDGVPESHFDKDETSIVDAERRLLYFDNIDSWGILALLGTAPESLSRNLGRVLSNYTFSRASIGVTFSTMGCNTFALQFSFPLRVWRTTSQLMIDNRSRKSNSESLRSSKDVTFLNPLAHPGRRMEETDGIYTTNISCLVTGLDRYRWTAIVLSETWFEDCPPDDPSPDMISRYENDLEDAAILFDPLCRGKIEAEKSEWSPRPYFVRVFEVRLTQIHLEWENLFANVHSRFQNLANRHKDFIREAIPSMEGSEDLLFSEHIILEAEEFESLLNEFQDLLRELAADLQETVRSGDAFMTTDVNYFLNYDAYSYDESDCLPCLSHIRRIFNDLRELSDGIMDMKNMCKDMLKFTSNRQKKVRSVASCRPDNDRIVLSNNGSLWTLFFRSPIPYFWVMTLLFNSPSDPLKLEIWGYLLLVAKTVLPLVLTTYGFWLLSRNLARRNHSRHESSILSNSRFRQQNNSSPATVGEQVARACRLAISNMMGAFTASHRRIFGSGETITEFPDDIEMTTHASGEFEDPTATLLSPAILPASARIPICISDGKSDYSRMQCILREECDSDRSFFDNLRVLVKSQPWYSLRSWLCRAGLRVPIAIYHVKFKLCGHGWVRLRARVSKFPPVEESSSYQPTENSGLSLIDLDTLLDSYNNPQETREDCFEIVDRLVHKIDGPFLKNQTGFGYGLEIQESLNSDRLWVIRISIATILLAFGIIWSCAKKDAQTGFTIAGCLLVFSELCANALQSLTPDSGRAHNEVRNGEGV